MAPGVNGQPVDLGTGADDRASGIDLDELVRRLEDRILSEIDRRGGRYVGSF